MTNESTKTMTALGKTLAYVDRGHGRPIVFLHGNPTSSYLWRNVIAPLVATHRCLAPDLIGMGDSEKLGGVGDARYSFEVHTAYLDVFLDAVSADEPIVLVVHDWGSALGFDWARRHPDRVRGIAYMEAIVGVMSMAGRPPESRAIFEAMRSSDGERMILEENLFLEKLLPMNVMRTLTADELDAYRRPFRDAGESRRPMLAWPRLLPYDGEPPAICAVVERYAAFLARSPIPKLFVDAQPGRILTGALRERCRAFPNQREVAVPGLHYPQEDSPAAIAGAIADWLRTIDATTGSTEAAGASA